MSEESPAEDTHTGGANGLSSLPGDARPFRLILWSPRALGALFKAMPRSVLPPKTPEPGACLRNGCFCP